MTTLADDNKAVCDDLLMDLASENADITVYYCGLHERHIISKDAEALKKVMDRLTGEFEFTSYPVFIDNALAFAIILPRIIQYDHTCEPDEADDAEADDEAKD